MRLNFSCVFVGLSQLAISSTKKFQNMKTEARKPYAEVEAGVAEGLRNDLGTAEESNLTIIKNAISFIVLFSEFTKSLQYTHNRL